MMSDLNKRNVTLPTFNEIVNGNGLVPQLQRVKNSTPTKLLQHLPFAESSPLMPNLTEHSYSFKPSISTFGHTDTATCYKTRSQYCNHNLEETGTSPLNSGSGILQFQQQSQNRSKSFPEQMNVNSVNNLEYLPPQNLERPFEQTNQLTLSKNITPSHHSSFPHVTFPVFTQNHYQYTEIASAPCSDVLHRDPYMINQHQCNIHPMLSPNNHSRQIISNSFYQSNHQEPYITPSTYNRHHRQQQQQYTKTTHPKPKRLRRKAHEMLRLYKCTYQNCNSSYGTLNHLNAHIQIKKHGMKRFPEEFKQIREWLKKREISNSGTAVSSRDLEEINRLLGR